MKDVGLDRLTVGVLCGGNSSERTISLRSGRAVLEALGRSGVLVRRIDPRNLRQAQAILPQIDLAFIALHGKGGEDGSIQRHLERAKIPYVGSDPHGSRLAFDKVQAKRVFEEERIPTPRWKVFGRNNWRDLKKFPTPFFVKPTADGSSIGVFLVEDFRRSAEKIMHALDRYGVLLAERRIEGREFTVGILGNRALPVVELRPKRVFYDYQAKYTPGMTEYLVPAPISGTWSRKVRGLAVRVHRALGLRDFSRVDIVSDKEGNPFVLEANTIPGFTELSLLPKAAREAGISFESLCLRLVKMALGRKNGKA